MSCRPAELNASGPAVAGRKTQVSGAAEVALPAICGLICMSAQRDENFNLWVSCLSEVLDDCASAPLSMASLRHAAWALVLSKGARAQSAAMSALRFQTEQYFAKAAAHKFDVWQQERNKVHASHCNH